MVDNAQFSANSMAQLTQTMTAIADALKAAGEKAGAGHQEIAKLAMKQAQDNAAQLLSTLQALAGLQDPTSAATAYTRFLTESAQKNGQQLLEISKLMAQTSKDVWGPVFEGLMKAAQPGKQ